MKFGVCIPNYGETLTSDVFREVALESEKLGYDSLWTTDHILMPRNSGTPYERILDSITSLAFLACQTKKIKLGISSLIIALRNPVEVAKQLSTIDILSGGRIAMCAIGTGWFKREFDFLSSNFHDRGRRVDESINLVRSLWKGETKFESKTLPYNYSEAVFEPLPSQRKIDIWIAGDSDAAMKRAADLGDAWHPNVPPLEMFEKLVSHFRTISPRTKNKPICVRIGLDIRATEAEYIGAQGERRILLTGNKRQNEDIISELEKLGATYALVVTSPSGTTNLTDQIEGLRNLSKEFLAG